MSASPTAAQVRQAIAADPRNPALHLELGDLLAQQNLAVEALAAYTEAIGCDPASPHGYHARAKLLANLRGCDQALADHRRAIEFAPEDVSLHLAMIDTLRAKGNYAQAQTDCRSALEIHPDSARLWESLGRIYQTTGQFDLATDAFRRSLQLEPSGFVGSLLSAMPGQMSIDECQQLIQDVEKTNPAPRDRAAGYFAFGDLLDRAERYDEAFTAYTRGNAIFKNFSREKGEFFDGPDLQKKVGEMIQTFTPDYFRQRADFAHLSDLPVFVVGMPRSGTSLVEQILASHSKVFGAGELPEIAMIRARLAQTVPANAARAEHRHWHRHLGKVHTARLTMMGGDAVRVVDKMPANILHLGLIATMLPQSRVIFCRRDPRDTCLSCYFQLFERHNLMFSYDLGDCGTQYRQQERLENHWKNVLPVQMLSVNYEDLVIDPETQSRRLIQFLGLDWEPNCVNFHQTRRAVLTKSVWQVRQPVYSGSVDRWKHYEKHLAALVDLQ